MERSHPRVPWAVFLVTALLLLFAGIAYGVSQDQFGAFDRSVILVFRDMTGPRGPAWMPEAARDVTSLGSVIVICLLAGAYVGYLLLNGQRRSAILLLVSLLGGLALNNLLKALFDRPRPDLTLVSLRVFSSSFPSGHAALSCVAYLTMAALIPRNAQAEPVRRYMMTAAIVLVLLIGMTRIYLGVHYPSDVLAGWCVGGAWVLTCWQAAKEIERRQYANGRQIQ